MLDSIDSIEALRESFAMPTLELQPDSLGLLIVRHAELLARGEQLCGLTLSVIDPLEQRFVSGISQALASDLCVEMSRTLQTSPVEIRQFKDQNLWVYGLRVPGTQLIAGGLLLGDAERIPQFIRHAAEMAGITEAQLHAWAQQHSGMRPTTAQRLLRSAHDLLQFEMVRADSTNTTTSVVGQLGKVYEEVVLIQDLAQYLRPDIDPLTLAGAVLERVQLIRETELSAFCLRHRNQNDYLLNGPWGLEGVEIETLLGEVLGDRTPQIIVRNHIDTSPLRLRFPTIRSIVAVPLFEDDEVPSWLILANPTHGGELGTEEANLLKSIGGVLSSHAQVVELFRDHEEMVLAFIRSLVSTLDAKDSYTRGHSERVALVAQRIAQEMELPQQEIQSIYQSGLLHDIGKIGVDDAVLQKQGSLNALEFRKIAKHPEVGYEILSELKNLAHLLPGVLHHHERFDGRGYPGKLAGMAIPRMARILAVADAFDAMGSDRPYRKGMSRQEVEQILAQGAGSQWDPEVVHAFFGARFEIYRIWARAIERQEQDNLSPLHPEVLDPRV